MKKLLVLGVLFLGFSFTSVNTFAFSLKDLLSVENSDCDDECKKEEVMIVLDDLIGDRILNVVMDVVGGLGEDVVIEAATYVSYFVEGLKEEVAEKIVSKYGHLLDIIPTRLVKKLCEIVLNGFSIDDELLDLVEEYLGFNLDSILDDLL